MKVRFKFFQFDVERQTLTKDQKVITLNEKPAKLLTLFLLNPEKILSKADILNFVWSDRVVTEQVIFQNISYLRSLFGSDAIKTFTKKGYQWQLPLEEVVEHKNDSAEAAIVTHLATLKTDDNNSAEFEPDSTKFPLGVKTAAILVIIFLLSILGWLGLNSNFISPAAETKFKNKEKNGIYSAIFEHGNISKTQLDKPASSQTLFDSPFSAWQSYSTNKNELLVATKTYLADDKTVLRFHIQGEKRSWTDYIIANNEQQAKEDLDNLLSLINSSGNFFSASDHDALSMLTLLSRKQPTNALIDLKLIQITFKLNNLDRATALIDRQLDTSPPRLRQGLLYLLKTDITMRNKLWSEARSSIEKALVIFKVLDLPQLESEALIQSSWIYYVEQEFREGMQVLNQAASKARASGEPLLEVNAHIIQSFIASKAGQTELALTQLNLASELIRLHQLSNEHEIQVQYNAAKISKSSSEALKHYENIANQPFSPQYEYIFYEASEVIAALYSEQKNWDQAYTAIKSWQRASFQALTRAKIAFSQGDFQQGLTHSKEAFKLAQLNYHRIDALNAALLILKNAKNTKPEFNSTEYMNFIKQNSTSIWLDQNKVELEQLNPITTHHSNAAMQLIGNEKQNWQPCGAVLVTVS